MQDGETYAADVVSVVSADPNSGGPGLIFEPQDFGLAPVYPARHQNIVIGSGGVVSPDPCFTGRVGKAADGPLYVVVALLATSATFIIGDPSPIATELKLATV